jgi:AI-2E family transporter
MNNENRFEQIAGMAILLLLVLGCFVVLRPFVSAVLLALILAYSTFPIYAWCERILKGRRGVAATLMTLLVSAVLLVPLIILGSGLAQQGAAATRWVRGLFSDGPPEPPSWVANIPVVGTQLYEYWQGLAHNTAKLLSELSELSEYLLPAGEWLLGALTIVGQGTIQLALSLFIAFFLYRNGIEGAKGLQSIAHRLGGERGTRILEVVGSTIKSGFNQFGTLARRGARCVVAWVYHLLDGSDSHRRALGVVPCSDLVILRQCNGMGDFLGAVGNFRRRWRRQYHPTLFYQPGQRSAFCFGFPRSARWNPCLWFSRFILGADVAGDRLRNCSGLGSD